MINYETNSDLRSSEITKTYGKEVVEVKEAISGIKEITESTDTKYSINKLKTENRKEYEVSIYIPNAPN